MAAVGWVVIDGLLNADVKLLTDVPPNAFRMDGAFWTGLGGATLIAAYDYGGYNTVCFLGGEVERPGRTIPGAILLALGAVVAMYVVMSSTILGVLPWREAMHSKYIVSDFVARLHGRGAAMVMTGLILATAFASVFAGMLGLARVPFAAASEGRFFRPFAQLHAEGFPSFSVLYIGAGSAVASLLTMDELVKALIVIQTLIQSLALVVAVTALRRTRPELPRPFRMWGYPVTSVVAFAGWSYIIATSGVVYIGSAGGLLVVGVGAYLLRARRAEEWPWLAGKR